MVGGTAAREDSDDVQHDASTESASNQPKFTEATSYEVIGTRRSSEATKPDWVSEIIDVSK